MKKIEKENQILVLGNSEELEIFAHFSKDTMPFKPFANKKEGIIVDLKDDISFIGVNTDICKTPEEFIFTALTNVVDENRLKFIKEIASYYRED